MKFRSLFLLLSLFASVDKSYGQMQMGLSHDNYHITENVGINPALSVDPKVWTDIRAFGAYAIMISNGVYMHKDSFNLFQNRWPEELSVNDKYRSFGGQAEGVIYGPAISRSLGKWSVGGGLAWKTYVIGRKVPLELTNFIVLGPIFPPYYGQRMDGGSYRGKSLSYAEFSVNGGYMIYQKAGRVINVGASIKPLLPIAGLGVLVDNFNYEIHDSVYADIYNFSGSYTGTDFALNNGFGMAVDFGVTYEKKVNKVRFVPHHISTKCKYIDYVYRVGFSVLDVGYANLKARSYLREANGSKGPWNEYNKYDVTKISEVISEADNLLARGINQVESSYKVVLPMALSLQFDYNFGYGFFVNSFLLYGVPFKKSYGAERLSMFAITPRFESARFGMAVPFSVNSFGKAGLGLSFRFMNVSFGTDNIFPFFLDMDIYRVDLYIQVKFPILTSPHCKRRGLGETFWRFKDCSAPGTNPKINKRPTKRDF